VFGDEKTVGKDTRSDLREGKNTLLMIELRKRGNPEQLQFQKKVLGSSDITMDDMEKIKGMLIESGSLDAVKQVGGNYVKEGLGYVAQISATGEVRDILESLLLYVLERTM
jgi:geranylgeranyl diphosphate synthase type I